MLQNKKKLKKQPPTTTLVSRTAVAFCFSNIVQVFALLFFMFVWRCPFGFFESEKRGRGKWLSGEVLLIPQPLCEYCAMKKVKKDKKQEIVKERDCEDWCFVCKDGGELILCDFE